jgi:hypothetical protein
VAEFKDQWSLEMALEVLASQSVEAGPWAEAATWLLLYGPPELRELLDEAANNAFAHCFPGVRPQGYDQTGKPYYDLHQLAVAQGISSEEMAEHLDRMQETLGMRLLVAGDRVYKAN